MIHGAAVERLSSDLHLDRGTREEEGSPRSPPPLHPHSPFLAERSEMLLRCGWNRYRAGMNRGRGEGNLRARRDYRRSRRENAFRYREFVPRNQLAPAIT